MDLLEAASLFCKEAESLPAEQRMHRSLKRVLIMASDELSDSNGLPELTVQALKDIIKECNVGLGTVHMKD